jgi:hypothetical protein
MAKCSLMGHDRLFLFNSLRQNRVNPLRHAGFDSHHDLI